MSTHEERCAAAGLCRECDRPPLVRWDGEEWTVGCCHLSHASPTIYMAAAGWMRQAAGCTPVKTTDRAMLAEVEARFRLVAKVREIEDRVRVCGGVAGCGESMSEHEHISDEYTAVYQPREASIVVKLYEVAGLGESDDAEFEWKVYMGRDGRETTDFAACDPVIQAEIKWGGCAHWDIGKNGYVHTCDWDGLRALTEAMLQMYDTSRRLLERKRT